MVWRCLLRRNRSQRIWELFVMYFFLINISSRPNLVPVANLIRVILLSRIYYSAQVFRYADALSVPWHSGRSPIQPQRHGRRTMGFTCFPSHAEITPSTSKSWVASAKFLLVKPSNSFCLTWESNHAALGSRVCDYDTKHGN